MGDEEWFTAPGVAPTPWQRLASERGARGLRRVAVFAARCLHRALMDWATRVVFRLRPEAKRALQDRVHRPDPPAGIVGRWRAEVAEAFYVAAVREHGCERLCDLLNKSVAFDRCLTSPRVLAAVRHLLDGDLKLSSLNYRAALPGGGAQPLHVDWPRAVTPPRFFACNTLWVLDDFTALNGATRIVPGSHRWGALPPQGLYGRHPQEVSLQVPAGSVIVLNSHVWHGGTRNRSAARRGVLQCYFVRRGERPQLDQQSFVRPSTRARLDAPTLHLLDAGADAAACIEKSASRTA